jgi:hypothetical protein
LQIWRCAAAETCEGSTAARSCLTGLCRQGKTW